MNNYNELINKPTINGKELIGDVSIKELPNVTSDDNGKILSVVGGEWEETLPSGIMYSLTEQKTGNKWLDGRDIYVKSISIESELTELEGNITIIDYYGISLHTSDYGSDYFDLRQHTYISLSDGVWNIETSGVDFENETFPNGLYMTLYYVKNTNNNG